MEPVDNASDHVGTDTSVEEAKDPNIFTKDADSKIVEKNTLRCTDLSAAVIESDKAVSIQENVSITSATSLAAASDYSKPIHLNLEAGFVRAFTTLFGASSERSTTDSENPAASKPCNLTVEAALLLKSSSTPDTRPAMSSESRDGSKLCNLDVEAGMSKTSPKFRNQTHSGESSFRCSANENQLLAFAAREKAAEATDAAASGRMLLETIHQTIGVIRANVESFLEKANERGNVDPGESEFYRNLASKYEAAVATLEERGEGVETAAKRAEAAAAQALESSDEVERAPDEARLARFQACKWKSQAEESCVLVLQKEHAALVAMKRIWLSVKEDLREEGDSSLDSSIHRNRQQGCDRFESRTRKTDVAHVAAFFIGVSLLGCSALFRTGSDSFNAVLTLGLFISGWTILYWIHKLYRYIRFCKKQNTTTTEHARGEYCDDGFLENVNSRLASVEEQLRNRKAAPISDSESNSGGSLETVQVSDIS